MEIDVKKIVKIVKEKKPFYDEKAIEKLAKDFIQELDESLAKVLYNYIENNEKKDYEHNELSLSLLHNGLKYSYLDSIYLLNVYMKDPNAAKMKIFRKD